MAPDREVESREKGLRLKGHAGKMSKPHRALKGEVSFISRLTTKMILKSRLDLKSI